MSACTDNCLSVFSAAVAAAAGTLNTAMANAVTAVERAAAWGAFLDAVVAARTAYENCLTVCAANQGGGGNE